MNHDMLNFSVKNCNYCVDGSTYECANCKENFVHVYDGRCLEPCKDGLVMNMHTGICMNTPKVDCPNIWGCSKYCISWIIA